MLPSSAQVRSGRTSNNGVGTVWRHSCGRDGRRLRAMSERRNKIKQYIPRKSTPPNTTSGCMESRRLRDANVYASSEKAHLNAVTAACDQQATYRVKMRQQSLVLLTLGD